MASTSGEFSVVHYFDAEKNEHKDIAEINGVEPVTEPEETNISDKVSETNKLNKVKEADNV